VDESASVESTVVPVDVMNVEASEPRGKRWTAAGNRIADDAVLSTITIPSPEGCYLCISEKASLLYLRPKLAK